jgi:tetratricopeptide (TPR) repeat protein
MIRVMPRREALAALICAALTVALFAPGLDYAFVYDDTQQLVGNPNVHGWDGLAKAWTHDVWAFDPTKQGANRYYRPLFMSVLTVLWQAFGEQPLGYHVVSLLLHLACGGLLVTLGASLGLSSVARVAALAVFLLHPVQIQATVWISAVSEPLFGCLALACSLLWLSWIRHGKRTPLMASLVMYGASMLLLERAVALAAPLLAMGWYRHALRAEAVSMPTPRMRARALFLQGVLLLLPVAGVWSLRHSALGAGGAQAEHWLRDTLFTAPGVAQRYLMHLVWPAELSIAYPHHMLSAATLTETWLPLALCAIVAALCVRASLGNAVRSVLLVSALMLCAPALAVGLLPGHALMADRYLYVPLAFLSLWLADFVWPSGALPSRAVVGRVLVLAAWCLGLLTLHRSNLSPWQDNYALHTRAVAAAPDNPIMLSVLAMERQARGEHDPECALTRRAAALVEAHPAWSDPVSVNVNLGHCELQHGRQREAFLAFDRAYVLSKGMLLQAGINRVRLLAQLGRVPDALRAGRALTKRHPQAAEAFSIYGLTLAVAGQPAEAEAALLRALELNPADSASQGLLARLRRAAP